MFRASRQFGRDLLRGMLRSNVCAELPQEYPRLPRDSPDSKSRRFGQLSWRICRWAWIRQSPHSHLAHARRARVNTRSRTGIGRLGVAGWLRHLADSQGPDGRV